MAPQGHRIAALGILALLAGCGHDLVEEVSTDVCASGKRWAGEFTASEEMYPGQDCVGCHRSVDGPPLFIAGTVYGVADPGGERTSRNLCFGVEGALVSVTMGDGAVLQRRTNRAGNFFFEGPEDALVAPYSVEVEYRLPDGRLTRQPMKTQPSYGGCARCHYPADAPTPGVLPGSTPAPDEVIEEVYPIYTGPVHE